jgi:capsular polysaccharide biosynthesis protein
MEAVTILRELRRRRAFVALVALVSVLIGLAVAYTVSLPPQSRTVEVAIASGRLLVDTPDSQVIDVQPKGSGTLGIRAGVVANLMTEGDVKAAIAQRAGLNPNQLRAGVRVDGELSAVLTKASGNPDAHLLVTSPALNPDGTPLPMVDIEAQAPGPEGAARLANAAVTGLNDYLDTKAAGEDVPDAERLQVTGLGAPAVHEEARGPSRLVAAAVAILIFLFGCAAILVSAPLGRAWRVAVTAEDERKSDDEEPGDEGKREDEQKAERVPWSTRLVGRLKKHRDEHEPEDEPKPERPASVDRIPWPTRLVGRLKKPEDEPTPAGLHQYTEGGNGADGSPNGDRSSNGDVPARSADAEGADGADGAESRSTAIPS